VPDFGDVEIQITLGGTLRSPRIDLSSVPVFDKSEIISIALFGTPNPSLGQQGQFNQAMTGLVTGAAAMPLRQALSEELGIDTVEFSQREDQGQTSSLFRIGTFFSPNVYVTYEQEFGGLEEYNLIGVRYRISDRVTVQASAGSRQLDRLVAGLDLFWEFTY
jgi:autotransporter translocation and assembly factor TamB